MTPIDEYHFQCTVCGLLDNHKLDCPVRYQKDEPEDEQDFLDGITCNPNAPEECELCQ